MKTKTLRVYIPVDITIPEDHIGMVMSNEWRDAFCEFADEKDFSMYAARLMMYQLIDRPIPGLTDLTKYDGHCVAEHKGKFDLKIPEDGWDTCEVEDWVEEY